MACGGLEATRVDPPRIENQEPPDPRRFAIHVGGSWSAGCSTKKMLSMEIHRRLPDSTKVTESLKTVDGRILIFTPDEHNYNKLLQSNKWKFAEGDFFVNPAPKSGGRSAVVVQGVESDISEDDVKAALQDQGFHASKVNRMKKAGDGEPTLSVKIFMDSETEIDRLIANKLTIFGCRHRAQRYTQSAFLQCYVCQKLGHSSSNCAAKEKTCMKCSHKHHFRSCLVEKADFLCSNCGGNHAANDKSCPKIKEFISLNSQRSDSRQSTATAAARRSNAAPTQVPPLEPLLGPAPGRPPSAASAWPSLRQSDHGPQQQPTSNTPDIASIADNLSKAIKIAVTEAMEMTVGSLRDEVRALSNNSISLKDSVKDLSSIIIRYKSLMKQKEERNKEERRKSLNNCNNALPTTNDPSKSTPSLPIPTGVKTTQTESLLPPGAISKNAQSRGMTLTSTPEAWIITFLPSELTIPKSKPGKETTEKIKEKMKIVDTLVKKDFKDISKEISKEIKINSLTGTARQEIPVKTFRPPTAIPAKKANRNTRSNSTSTLPNQRARSATPTLERQQLFKFPPSPATPSRTSSRNLREDTPTRHSPRQAANGIPSSNETSQTQQEDLCSTISTAAPATPTPTRETTATLKPLSQIPPSIWKAMEAITTPLPLIQAEQATEKQIRQINTTATEAIPPAPAVALPTTTEAQRTKDHHAPKVAGDINRQPEDQAVTNPDDSVNRR